jgi:phospholipase/carboxylesterase
MTLTTHIEGPANAPLTVVLLHGFGAPGDDLVPIGSELENLRPELRGKVRWVYPVAPLVLEEPARAWWLIDDAHWKALQTRDPALLVQTRERNPPGLPAARDAVIALIASLRKDAAPESTLVVGGFSQGAMLSTEVALNLQPAPQGLVLFSSSLIHASEWTRLAPTRAGLPVFQSHGEQDPVLPFSEAERARDLLQAGGLTVDFLPFTGGHTLTVAVLQRAAAFLADRVRLSG